MQFECPNLSEKIFLVARGPNRVGQRFQAHEQTRQISEAAKTQTVGGEEPARSTYAPDAEPASVGQPGIGEAGGEERPNAGTSNRVFQEQYGDQAPVGQGADIGAIMDGARQDLAARRVDPYEILSRTRNAPGAASDPEYAALALEHSATGLRGRSQAECLHDSAFIGTSLRRLFRRFFPLEGKN
jgi:hypothetical protein